MRRVRFESDSTNDVVFFSDLVPLSGLKFYGARCSERGVSFGYRVGVEGYGVYIGSEDHGLVPEVVEHDGAYVLIFRKNTVR